MSDDTLRAYDEHAEEWAAYRTDDDYWAADREWLIQQIESGARIVEFGAGAGNEGVHFIQAGLDYTGIDGSVGMLAIAERRIPPEQLRLADLREVELADGEQTFDGFWCAAVLLHIPRTEIDGVLRRMRGMLAEGAPGFIAVKGGTGEAWDDRLAAPRFFCYWQLDEFADVLAEGGFRVESMRVKEDGRNEKPRWNCYRVRCA
jgi:predicted TPR repeat methyltransferase